jgi:thiamine kinase-like enzyme
MSKIDYSILNTNPFYTNFHGDLQFDNIIHDGVLDKYTYIDWRESFAGNTESGDIYYDLAKLYGGCIIPYDKMKDDNNIQLTHGVSTISYSYHVSDNLTKFKVYYENWLVDQGYDLEKIKLITALIFLNMSPLHTEKFSMMLWFKSIELLHEYTNK